MLYNNCIHIPDWKWHAYKEGIMVLGLSGLPSTEVHLPMV